MTLTSRSIAAVLVLGAVAFLAGRLTGDGPGDPGPRPVAPGSAPGMAEGTSGPARVDVALRAEIRQTVRDELRAALADQSRPEPALDELDPTEAAAPPSDAASAAVERGRALVAAASAAGRWTDADAQALRMALRGQPGPQRHEIARTLFQAINRGDIKPELTGPAF